jgi:ParB family chromosome partitioning protein
MSHVKQSEVTVRAQAIPQHSSKTNEHYTPVHVVEAARKVLGAIDLDPASCEQANRTVKATRWIGLPDDGLIQEWHGRIFLNPPGGALKDCPEERRRWDTNSRACAWWRKLMQEAARGNVTTAVFVGFTLEILRSTQGGKWQRQSAMQFPFCVPAQRLKFGGDQPTHANAIMYVGHEKEKFAEIFSPIGEVRL